MYVCKNMLYEITVKPSNTDIKAIENKTKKKAESKPFYF